METENKNIKNDTKKKVSKKKKVEEVNEIISSVSCIDLENKFLLVRVGTIDNPASTDQINEVQEKLEDMLNKHNIKCLAFVTHHAVDMTLIEKRVI
jgi:hypothetical protein